MHDGTARTLTQIGGGSRGPEHSLRKLREGRPPDARRPWQGACPWPGARRPLRRASPWPIGREGRPGAKRGGRRGGWEPVYCGGSPCAAGRLRTEGVCRLSHTGASVCVPAERVGRGGRRQCAGVGRRCSDGRVTKGRRLRLDAGHKRQHLVRVQTSRGLCAARRQAAIERASASPSWRVARLVSASRPAAAVEAPGGCPVQVGTRSTASARAWILQQHFETWIDFPAEEGGEAWLTGQPVSCVVAIPKPARADGSAGVLWQRRKRVVEDAHAGGRLRDRGEQSRVGCIGGGEARGGLKGGAVAPSRQTTDLAWGHQSAHPSLPLGCGLRAGRRWRRHRKAPPCQLARRGKRVGVWWGGPPLELDMHGSTVRRPDACRGFHLTLGRRRRLLPGGHGCAGAGGKTRHARLRRRRYGQVRRPGRLHLLGLA
eukprot:scaffold1681_cov105-Isochrysis_galbana.AAC.3